MNIAYKLTSPSLVGEIVLESQGNFGYQKALAVDPIINDMPTYGIIIQVVNKTTVMQDSTGTIYNTSEDISNYTNENVKFSNDSYFEYWLIHNNGRTEQDDRFGNNSLVKYIFEDDKYVPETYDLKSKYPDDVSNYHKFKTQGKITINSMSCFIASWNPLYDKIIKLGWIRDYVSSELPANGLPYLGYTPEIYNDIFNNRNSNLLQHDVIVSWTFDNPNSVLLNIPESKPKELEEMSGGRYKKTYKYSRKYSRKHARKYSRKYTRKHARKYSRKHTNKKIKKSNKKIKKTL